MALKDFLFPKFCLGCGLIGIYICPRCFSRVEPAANNRCSYCTKSNPNGLTHPACLQRLNADGIFSIFRFGGILKKIVKTIKYRLATDVFDELVNNINVDAVDGLMGMKKIYKGAVIQPIPLAREKFRIRGFNLAGLLAEYFSRTLGLKTADYLMRKNGGTPQAEAGSKKERYLNVRGKFVLRPGIGTIHKKIIVVDDIMTSGATIGCAVRALKKSGAETVYGLSLAAG